MDFTLSERETYFRDRVRAFIARHVAPREHDYEQHIDANHHQMIYASGRVKYFLQHT
jgi:alkylation response protein AidB-like acyl-CoA dehydrogenase